MIREHAVLDVSRFPRVNADQKDPLWWGILGLILIELTVVLGFVVSYFYLRMGRLDWPPAGTQLPPLLWESLNLGLLAASALVMGWAGKQIKQGDQKGLIVGVSIALVLNLLVLLFRWFQIQELLVRFRWSDHAYGSMVWVITGFHFTHVASAIVGTAVILVLALRGFWNQERQLAVVVDTFYWYFVSFAWLPLYLTVYWVPRLL